MLKLKFTSKSSQVGYDKEIDEIRKLGGNEPKTVETRASDHLKCSKRVDSADMHNNWVLKLPRDVLRHHFFLMLSLSELGRLDTATTNHGMRCHFFKDALNGLIIKGPIRISSTSCIKWTISKGIQFLDIECENLNILFCRALFKFNPNVKRLCICSGKFNNSLIRLISKRLRNISVIQKHGTSNDVRDDAILELSHQCPNIVQIDLSNCLRLTNASIIALSKGCPNLSHFIACHKLTDNSVVALSKGCPNIVHLDISGGCSSLNDYSIICLSKQCQKLAYLNVSGCLHITCASIIALSQSCPDLIHFDLSDCISVEFSDDLALALSRACLKLVHLNISGLEAIDSAIVTLSQGCRQLTHVNLSHCGQLTDVSILALSERCPNLSILDISSYQSINNTSFTDTSIIPLCQRCPLLSQLNLSGCCGITNVAIVSLSQHCSNITYLDLSMSRSLTDLSIIALSRSCVNLTNLNISGCNMITNDSIMALSHGCKKLIYLNLGHLKYLTIASIGAILQNCPNLHKLFIPISYMGESVVIKQF